MKKLLLPGIILLMTNVVFSCRLDNRSQNMNDIPFIEVTGSAEIEIDPDEIRLTVVISGYENRKERVKLEEVDKNLLKILSGAGLSKKNIILKDASTQGYWYYYWWRYDREIDARMTKQFEVIFNDYAQLNDVLAKLPGPKEGFLNVNISSLKNKNITEYRKQTKIEAIKAAQEKARYLLESVGSSPGRLLTVMELDEDDWGWRQNFANSNVISQANLSATNDHDHGDDASMQKIKLRYRIKARFEVK